MNYLIVLLSTLVSCTAATVTIAWDANPESDIAGYYVTWTQEGYFDRCNLEWTDTTNCSVNVSSGVWLFGVTAVNTSGLESDYSTIVGTIPASIQTAYLQINVTELGTTNAILSESIPVPVIENECHLFRTKTTITKP